MPDPVTGLVVGAPLAGGILSTVIGADTSRKAANTQADAAQRATDTQLSMYERQREDLAPWRLAGGNALTALTEKIGAGPGDYQKSPSYDFLLGEGVRAMERGAASRGKQFSGAQAKALTAYGQNVASSDYDNWLRRWYQSLTPYQSLAGVGLTAGSQTGAGALTTGQAIAGNELRVGNALAAGQMGVGNSMISGLNWLGNQGGQAGMNLLRPSTGRAGGWDGGTYYSPVSAPTADYNPWNLAPTDF